MWGTTPYQEVQPFENPGWGGNSGGEGPHETQPLHGGPGRLHVEQLRRRPLQHDGLLGVGVVWEGMVVDGQPRPWGGQDECVLTHPLQ